MITKCGSCGGAYEGRTFSGEPVRVCAGCGNVLLTAPVASILLGPPAPLPPKEALGVPDPPSAAAETPEPVARSTGVLPWLLGMGLVTVVLGGMAAVAVLMFVYDRSTRPSPGAIEVAVEEPAVPTATASNVQRLVAEGWTLVADDPNAAADRFRAAVELTPRDGAASYGLGYALLRTGAKDEATQHLCRAKSYADRDTSREVANLLEHEGLRCP
jgi:hypothetical protein